MTDTLSLTPQEAVEALSALYEEACEAQRGALARYLATREPPPASLRARFRYPELRLTYAPGSGRLAPNFRAYAKFTAPGAYTVSVTQPDAFRAYLIDQLAPLAAEYGARIEVARSDQEIPYPYVLRAGDDLVANTTVGVTPADLARHFPVPLLSLVGDEVPDGEWRPAPGEPLPLALFDAVRTDYSLRRLVHYTGTDWRDFQPWILLTNYHRYVDQFVRYGLQALRQGGPYTALSAAGGARVEAGEVDEGSAARVLAAPWHRHQMPAYHLHAGDGQGVTLVNIGVGPSNAKTITDHLAVLRPHAWIMIGHCGGLRGSQSIGDYVLAHAYLRDDKILDAALPPEIPVPALAEIQVALQEAAAHVTGDDGEVLKSRLRTGTVVTTDDRNWELRWSKERRRFNLSRAVAIDMESGTVAAQGYRLRVPYGTLLCVSDKPLHGELKLPGAANAFYERAVGEHLRIGIETIERLKRGGPTIHSRKLRSFDEPPFR